MSNAEEVVKCPCPYCGSALFKREDPAIPPGVTWECGTYMHEIDSLWGPTTHQSLPCAQREIKELRGVLERQARDSAALKAQIKVVTEACDSLTALISHRE